MSSTRGLIEPAPGIDDIVVAAGSLGLGIGPMTS